MKPVRILNKYSMIKYLLIPAMGAIAMFTLFEYFPSLPSNVKEFNVKEFVGLTIVFTASFIVDIAIKDRILKHVVTLLICEATLVILLFFVFPTLGV